MAHEARLSTLVRPAVAGETILEGKLVRLVASGVREDLPIASLAASGTTFNVYVAFAAPDNFSRPTPGSMYTADRTGQFYESDSWGDNKETETWYRVGLSTFENPVLASGYVMLAKRGGIYTVPSGVIVANASLKTVGALVKVSDDGTGRWEYASSETGAIGQVVDWNPTLEQYTIQFLDK